MIKKIIGVVASLRLTVALLIALSGLTFVMTLAQVSAGIYEAKRQYFDGFFVWMLTPSGEVPVFFGGKLLAIVLTINLVAAHLTRFKWRLDKIGMWLTHIGLFVLLIGSGYTAWVSVESQMMISENQLVNYSESQREVELVVVKSLSPTRDRVVAFPQTMLTQNGATLQHPELPFRLQLLTYYPNSRLEMNADVGQELPHATNGFGAGITAFPMPIVRRDDYRNIVTAIVAIEAGGKSLGTYLVSNGLGAPQAVVVNGQSYALSIRPTRYYNPFFIRLDRFVQEYYPDTTIPKNYASKITVIEPGHPDMPTTIFMNNPLRHGGKTFYQASFGKDGKSTIFQVVRNPGWLVPYISSIIMSIGLAIHFSISLTRFWARRRAS